MLLLHCSLFLFTQELHFHVYSTPQCTFPPLLYFLYITFAPFAPHLRFTRGLLNTPFSAQPIYTLLLSPSLSNRFLTAFPSHTLSSTVTLPLLHPATLVPFTSLYLLASALHTIPPVALPHQLVFFWRVKTSYPFFMPQVIALFPFLFRVTQFMMAKALNSAGSLTFYHFIISLFSGKILYSAAASSRPHFLYRLGAAYSSRRPRHPPSCPLPREVRRPHNSPPPAHTRPALLYTGF